MLFIFDLDLTLICSRHRQATLPDGSLDLDHWIENNTPEKIMQDSLLPLGRQVAHYLRTVPPGRINIACTARYMQKADYKMLRKYNLNFDKILSRPKGNSEPDHLLKEKLLRKFALTQKMPFKRLMAQAIIWDDNENVRNHLTEYGLKAYNPIEFNEKHAGAI
jgi:hypothetical protein